MLKKNLEDELRPGSRLPSAGGGEDRRSGAPTYLELIDENRDGVEFIILVLTLHHVCAVLVLGLSKGRGK